MKIRSGFVARCRLVLVAALAAFSFGDAIAHGASVGAMEITHPFATPSLPGATTGAAYFATLANTGASPDKLLRAATPVAASVEMHTMSIDAQGVMRMREVDAIPIAPNSEIRMRPGGGFHLMLVGLKQPLKEGDTFPLSLQFERAGKVEVKVYVQTPRASGAMGAMQPH